MRYKDLDLELLAEKLDITPTMYEYAVGRYLGIYQYLSQNGIDADFYPQGSFRTGTVVRPIKNGDETDFDLDVMCTLSYDKEKAAPKQIKTIIGDALSTNATYREILLPEDSRCWSLQYAGVSDEIGFILDIVPSVGDTQENIEELISAGVPDVFAVTAVSITEKKENDYSWLPSNPKGYGNWFDEINKPFWIYDHEARKKRFFANNRGQFRADATIESVPEYHIKSSLQRVIQLLKRHRELFYLRIQNGEQLRPASIIITTLAARIARTASPMLSIEQLLSFVVHGLLEYASLLRGQIPPARFDGDIRTVIERRSEKWWIPNPVNPRDNFADSWTDDTAKAFFKWIEAVGKDLAEPTPVNEQQYVTGLQRSFGTKFVNSSLSITPSITQATTTITTPTRPWNSKEKWK